MKYYLILILAIIAHINHAQCPAKRGHQGGGLGSPSKPGPVVPPKCNICIPVLHAFDPNDIAGPEGYGPARYVRADASLQYVVRFENNPEFATAPAQKVVIRMPVDANFKLYSFRLGEFGFGKYRYQPPSDMSYYSTRITNTADSLGVYVDLTAGIDVVKKEAFWVFESINPATGLRPDDALKGFLPVNDTTINRFNDTIPKPGEGFVTFLIRPRDGAITGDTCKAKAEIVFDNNPAIPTNLWTNVVDAGAPHSQLRPLPSVAASNSIPISWDATDDPGGSGLHDYDLYVSKNNGPFYLQKADIDTTVYYFQGLPGEKYAFYTRASDQVGNEEPGKDAGEEEVTLGVQQFVLLETPLEGAQYCAIDSISIVWQAKQAGNDFDLLLSTDGGGHFEKIQEGLDSLESPFSWVIPAHLGIAGSDNCRFMILSNTDTTLFGWSKRFSILKSPDVNLGPDTTIFQGDQLTLTAGSAATATYLWNTGATGPNIQVTATGLYSVTATDANGCSNSDSIQVNVILATNTPGFARSLRLFPNPASARMTLQGELETETMLEMEILSADGRLIKKLQKVHTGKGRFSSPIQVQGLHSGLYLLGIKAQNGATATLTFEKIN